MAKTTSFPTLQALRQELDALDERLLNVAAHRLDVVKRIRSLKADSGHSQFDRARERDVLERARQIATRLDLEPELGERLVGLLVETSHRLQEQQVAPVDHSTADVRDIAIVGGGGRMGRLLGRALKARGHRLSVLEREDGQDRPSVVRAADIVMIAVPVAIASRVAAGIAPHVRPDALLCDINSLKEEICGVMQQGCVGEVLGTHPMFGPTVQSLRRQKVVVCPVKAGARATWLKTELGRMGLEVIETEPAHHDRMMAVVQVLVHFRTLVMGEALRRTGTSIADSLRFTSPIYRLELAVVGRLFAQDPALYAEIEMANPRAAEVRRHFIEAAHRLEDILQAGDRQGFEALFAEAASYFSAFSAEAMRLSDFLIETLVRQP